MRSTRILSPPLATHQLLLIKAHARNHIHKHSTKISRFIVSLAGEHEASAELLGQRKRDAAFRQEQLDHERPRQPQALPQGSRVRVGDAQAQQPRAAYTRRARPGQVLLIRTTRIQQIVDTYIERRLRLRGSVYWSERRAEV